VGADRLGTWRPHCSNADRRAGALDDRRARGPGDGCPGGTVSAAAVQRRDPVGHRGAPSERDARTAATNRVIQARRGAVMTLIVIALVTVLLQAYEDPRAGDPGRASPGLVVRRALALLWQIFAADERDGIPKSVFQ